MLNKLLQEWEASEKAYEEYGSLCPGYHDTIGSVYTDWHKQLGILIRENLRTQNALGMYLLSDLPSVPNIKIARIIGDTAYVVDKYTGAGDAFIEVSKCEYLPFFVEGLIP